MAEDLELHESARGPLDPFALDRFGNRARLLERELAGEHRDVGVGGIKAQRLDVRDVELRREVGFETDRAGVEKGRGVGDDGRRNALGLRAVEHPAHEREILVVEDRVHREVRAHARGSAPLGDLAEVVDAEGLRGERAHVERLDAEVDRIRPGAQRGGERLAAPDGGHDFVGRGAAAGCVRRREASVGHASAWIFERSKRAF